MRNHRKLLLCCTAIITISALAFQIFNTGNGAKVDTVASYISDPAVTLNLEQVKQFRSARKWKASAKLLLMPEMAGSPQAQFYLGYQYSRGWGVSRNPKLALERLLNAVRFPIPQRADAAFEIAKLYRMSKTQDCLELAFQWFIKAREFGHRKADLELGKIYWRGQGVEADFDRAVSHFQFAANNGSSHAVFQWATLVHQGLGKRAGDRLKAASVIARYLNRIQQDANNGNRSAARSLGRLYRDGLIVSVNNEEARKWFQLAAKLGDASAMHDLAMLSLAQETPWYTDVETIELLTESAERNYTAAYTALGRLHLDQKLGLRKSDAVAWLEKGVANAHAGSMEELARLHWAGHHPEANKKVALELASRGAALKHKGCIKLLKEMKTRKVNGSSTLTSAQLDTQD